MSETFEYTAELQLHDGSVVPVNLEERGWAEPERLALTRVFTLVPRQYGTPWPMVRIHIPDGAKPIFKARKSVAATAGFQMRIYAVGWFKDGESHWTWVFPGGALEKEIEETELDKTLIGFVNDAWRYRFGDSKEYKQEIDRLTGAVEHLKEELAKAQNPEPEPEVETTNG
jgi:hypothetical protein